MDQSELNLLEKLMSFELDDSNSSFTFSDRLARENDWSLEYSIRAIHEYKRFIYLIIISKEPLTPSDEIDQVWHLHLLYTQSYWKDMCRDLLKTEIHHGPTKGIEERDGFKDAYQNTLSLYKKVFDEEAPKDIWPDGTKRFSSIHFSRVNRHKYWLLPKIKLRK